MKKHNTEAEIKLQIQALREQSLRLGGWSPEMAADRKRLQRILETVRKTYYGL